MARARRSLLGIELHENEIRIVEAAGTGINPIVTAAGSVPMPGGAFKDGIVVRPDLLAIGIQRLINSLRVSTHEVVFGIPTKSSVTRPVTIPPAPDAEIPNLIAGEVRYFQIMSSECAYDYFPLVQKSKKEAENTYVLMAVDEKVAASLREVAQKAGLKVVALEPVPISMFRTAYHQLASEESALFVAITEGATEIAMTHKGEIELYRRIDLGTDTLLKQGSSWSFDDRGYPVEEKSEDPLLKKEDASEEDSSALRSDVADNIAVEIRRSLEYTARENPSAGKIKKVVLALNAPVNDDIIDWLKTVTQAEIEIAAPPETTVFDAGADSAFNLPDGARFAAALGLSLHAYQQLPASVPKMDLYVQERTAADLQSKRKGLAGILIVCIVIVLLGAYGAITLGNRANDTAHDVEHLDMNREQLQMAYDQLLQTELSLLRQVDLLEQDGVEAHTLADAVNQNIAQGTGLNEMQFNLGGVVRLYGESVSEASLIQTVESLQSYPPFGTLSITSFERRDKESPDSGIHFQLANLVNVGGPPR